MLNWPQEIFCNDKISTSSLIYPYFCVTISIYPCSVNHVSLGRILFCSPCTLSVSLSVFCWNLVSYTRHCNQYTPGILRFGLSLSNTLSRHSHVKWKYLIMAFLSLEMSLSIFFWIFHSPIPNSETNTTRDPPRSDIFIVQYPCTSVTCHLDISYYNFLVTGDIPWCI